MTSNFGFTSSEPVHFVTVRCRVMGPVPNSAQVRARMRPRRTGSTRGQPVDPQMVRRRRRSFSIVAVGLSDSSWILRGTSLTTQADCNRIVGCLSLCSFTFAHLPPQPADCLSRLGKETTGSSTDIQEALAQFHGYSRAWRRDATALH